MAIKAILLPDSKTCVAIGHISRIAAYPNGVGIFNIREKMVGWIECSDESVSASIVSELSEIINNPSRAKQPDWDKWAEPEKVD